MFINDYAQRRYTLKIGFHMSVGKGFDSTLEQAQKLGCEVVQIFLKNPRSWAKKTWRDEDLASFNRLKKKVGVCGHLSYLPNIARIDQDEKNLKGFVHEIELCERLGLGRIVIHPGSREDRQTGIRMISTAINYVLERYDVKLLLENSAGQGSGIGKTPDDFAAIYEQVERKKNIGLCIDTAHLFEAGYDIRNRKIWDDFIRDIKKKLGKGKIGFFHLNDSRTPVGSHTDRHWHIGKGEIGVDFFRSLVTDKRFAHLEGVMETPKMGNMDKENMRTMRSLLSPLMSRSLA